jgi:hypothetical protein
MRTFSKHLKEQGLTQLKVDPCLFYTKDKEGEIDLLVTLFIDNTLVAGTKSRVEWLYKVIKTKFNIGILGKLKKHLGIWWKWRLEKGKIVLEADMPKMKEDIIIAFAEAKPDIKIKDFATPATPGKILTKNKGDVIQENDYP